MPDYAVRTDFLGRDRVSDVYDRMGRAADRYGDRAQSAMNRVNRSADHASTALRNASKHGYNFGAIVKGILAANAIRGGIGMIGGAVQDTVRSFLEFDDVAVQAAAKFDDLGYMSKNFGKNLETVKQQARDWAVGTRFSINDVMNAMHSFSEAGWRDDVISGLMPYTLKAASASGEKDLGSFITDVSGAFRGMGLAVGTATQQSQKFITFLDQIVQAAVDANGGINDVKEAMKSLAPQWKGSNSPASMLGYVVTMLNGGFQPEMVSTAGRAAAMRMSSDANVKAQLAAGRISIKDPKTGLMRPELDIFTDIKKQMDRKGIKFGSPEEKEIHKMLFGTWAASGNKTVMDYLPQWRAEQDKIEHGSHGVSKGISDVRDKFSTMNKVLVLSTILVDKAFTVLEAFNGKGQTGIDGLTTRIKNFDMKPMIKTLKATGTVLGITYDLLAPFLPAIPYLAGAWLGWNVALKAFAAYKVAAVIYNIAAALTAGLGPVGAMTTAVTALGGALATMAAPLLALAPIIGTAGVLLLLSGATSNAMKNNGWGDDRTGDQLVAESQQARAAAAGAKQMMFKGELNINGAPKGSTLSQSQPLSAFDINLFGQQAAGAGR